MINRFTNRFMAWALAWLSGSRCVSSHGPRLFHCIHRNLEERMVTRPPNGKGCQLTPVRVVYWVHIRKCCRCGLYGEAQV